MKKVPFAPTFVMYEQGDLVGEGAALLSLAPVFIIVAYVTLLISRRELHVAFALLGQLVNVVLNFYLKVAIDAPRPTGCDRTDPGMPSDHAQFMGAPRPRALRNPLRPGARTRLPKVGRARRAARSPGISSARASRARVAGFWATYLCIFLIVRVRFERRLFWRTAIGLLVLALTGAVAAARVYLGYHTIAQVNVGLCVGMLTGISWYAAYEGLIRPNVGAILRACGPVGDYLYLSDCSHIRDIVSWQHDMLVNAKQQQLAPGAANKNRRE
jgi:dolichyldiphosphatase